MTHVNALTHPVDLDDGRVIPAGGGCTPGPGVHDQALIDQGALVPVDVGKKKPVGKSSRGKDGDSA